MIREATIISVLVILGNTSNFIHDEEVVDIDKSECRLVYRNGLGLEFENNDCFGFEDKECVEKRCRCPVDYQHCSNNEHGFSNGLCIKTEVLNALKHDKFTMSTQSQITRMKKKMNKHYSSYIKGHHKRQELDYGIRRCKDFGELDRRLCRKSIYPTKPVMDKDGVFDKNPYIGDRKIKIKLSNNSHVMKNHNGRRKKITVVSEDELQINNSEEEAKIQNIKSKSLLNKSSKSPKSKIPKEVDSNKKSSLPQNQSQINLLKSDSRQKTKSDDDKKSDLMKLIESIKIRDKHTEQSSDETEKSSNIHCSEKIDISSSEKINSDTEDNIFEFVSATESSAENTMGTDSDSIANHQIKIDNVKKLNPNPQEISSPVNMNKKNTLQPTEMLIQKIEIQIEKNKQSNETKYTAPMYNNKNLIQINVDPNVQDLIEPVKSNVTEISSLKNTSKLNQVSICTTKNIDLESSTTKENNTVAKERIMSNIVIQDEEMLIEREIVTSPPSKKNQTPNFANNISFTTKNKIIPPKAIQEKTTSLKTTTFKEQIRNPDTITIIKQEENVLPVTKYSSTNLAFMKKCNKDEKSKNYAWVVAWCIGIAIVIGLSLGPFFVHLIVCCITNEENTTEIDKKRNSTPKESDCIVVADKKSLLRIENCNSVENVKAKIDGLCDKSISDKVLLGDYTPNLQPPAMASKEPEKTTSGSIPVPSANHSVLECNIQARVSGLCNKTISRETLHFPECPKQIKHSSTEVSEEKSISKPSLFRPMASHQSVSECNIQTRVRSLCSTSISREQIHFPDCTKLQVSSKQVSEESSESSTSNKNASDHIKVPTKVFSVENCTSVPECNIRATVDQLCDQVIPHDAVKLQDCPRMSTQNATTCTV